MNNLIVGNTSQLSYFFPDENFVKISSRNLNLENLTRQEWGKVFICFGESRKFITDINLHDDINFYFTIKVVDALLESAESIIIYSTCELWNKCEGQISLDSEFNFYSTPYTQSKYKLSQFVLSNRQKYKNVIILYPFNFNSIYRSVDFLFGKIFHSIVNKKMIEIGDTYFYRDIIHPKYVVDQSLSAKSDNIIGSGRKIFVNDFIRDLYDYFGLRYQDLVVENYKKFNEYSKKNEYYLRSNTCTYNYKELFEDTVKDIKLNIQHGYQIL